MRTSTGASIRLLADVLQRAPAALVVPDSSTAQEPNTPTPRSFGIRQRRVGRAPHPRALRLCIGAANPHHIHTILPAAAVSSSAFCAAKCTLASCRPTARQA
eukprot:scaffold7207_cov62-Phaeocystis_antarctica.AAC.1